MELPTPWFPMSEWAQGESYDRSAEVMAGDATFEIRNALDQRVMREWSPELPPDSPSWASPGVEWRVIQNPVPTGPSKPLPPPAPTG